ncbi:MAG: hypothetical protein FWD39_02605 [Clostridiales bacterium]|nr:hypothetical protein [Clostridiales bacterium]
MGDHYVKKNDAGPAETFREGGLQGNAGENQAGGGLGHRRLQPGIFGFVLRFGMPSQAQKNGRILAALSCAEICQTAWARVEMLIFEQLPAKQGKERNVQKTGCSSSCPRNPGNAGFCSALNFFGLAAFWGLWPGAATPSSFFSRFRTGRKSENVTLVHRSLEPV